jgi:ATP-dependent DNA ligase
VVRATGLISGNMLDCVIATDDTVDGRALYRAVVDADLEGVVAKHLGDAYRPNVTR